MLKHWFRSVWILLFIGAVSHAAVFAQVQIDNSPSLSTKANPSGFPLIVNGKTAPILFSQEDYKGVHRAISSLKNDFKMVSGSSETFSDGRYKVIIGTLGKSGLVDQLARDNKIDPRTLRGKNEKFIMQLVKNPVKDVETALVIAGSDMRGTIYGIYELSKQMGVSPWYYWADVPVQQQKNLYFNINSVYTEGEPAVKYRGIFLNDEAPALTGWARATFGGYNHQFYEKVFELLLRLKANFMWPAMWGSAFYDDDPENGKLANEMGIVMSTSHHEPMARAQQEWKRHGNGGDWNYQTNKQGLQDFWRGGIERAKNWESIITIAMRGDGDEPMSEDQNIGLLEQIVKDQRKIISEVTGKKASATPQVWALYKEVQDYYDKGMRVPDDVTLLLCDDNWGNVRKLPALGAKPRSGGYGMYYHFDYVGAPRNSKWLNVTQIQRVWEQMNLTYQHGVDKIWVVNVGDLKPMEYPISFFLDMAWNPNQFNANNLLAHTEEWCAQQFGEQYAKEAAELINLYTKYNHRVTPELLNDRTYSLENYNEFERVRDDYRDLLIRAMRLYNRIPKQYQDAFDQLVLFPINGCSNLYDMYYAVAMNKKLAGQGKAEANKWASIAEECFKRDSALTYHYNKEIAGGKWAHMMDQVRIGYRSWNDPRNSIMPKVLYVEPKQSQKIYAEKNGYVSIEAEDYFKAQSGKQVHWQIIPDLGKTKSGLTTMPVTEKLNPDVYVEYKVDLQTVGKGTLTVRTSPTLNYNENKGLRYALSIDGGPEQIVNINGHYRGELGKWQAERVIDTKHELDFAKKGEHSIRIRPLEQGIVFQKLMLDMGGLKPSYLGPPESEVNN